jgi:hypothetical protein
VSVQSGDILGVYSDQSESPLAYVYNSEPSAIQSLAHIYQSSSMSNDNASSIDANFTVAAKFDPVVFPYNFAVAAFYYYSTWRQEFFFFMNTSLKL